MKLLKVVVAGLVILALGVVVLGALAPPVQYESSVVIDKSVEETWQVMGDESKNAQWLSGYLRTEPVSGTPRTPGAVSRIYFEENGSEMVIEETIKTVVPNRRMAMHFASEFMDMDYELVTTGTDHETELRSQTTATGNGVIARAMMLLLAGSLREQEDTNLRALKGVVEANMDAYGAPAQ